MSRMNKLKAMIAVAKIPHGKQDQLLAVMAVAKDKPTLYGAWLSGGVDVLNMHLFGNLITPTVGEPGINGVLPNFSKKGTL